MRFRAFYADGTEITSRDMIWADLPDQDLVVAVWWDEKGTRHLECGADAIIEVTGELISVNLPTSEFRGAARRSGDAIKFGVYMAPEAWATIRKRADDARVAP